VRPRIFGTLLADGIRLSLIDDSNRDDHYHLRAEDTCYYLFEYTSHRDYSFSQTNNLISNLKKKPSQAGQPSYQYKGRAIAMSAQCLAATLNPNWLQIATLVPVPGSKALGHPDYDDRIARICRLIRQPPPDVRTLVIQMRSTNASHEVGQGDRVTVDELLDVYQIDEAVAHPLPQAIGIVDDVLTAGTHYRAMHHVISQRFPNVPIVGVFIARRIFPEEEPPVQIE
jgi:predicted amidophosphoribosyltransferase